MCGIGGIWEGGDEAGRVEAMLAAMRHRGPDDEGVYRDSRVALGMTRLAVIDLSPGGRQPMANPDGTVHIVYNGETYNFHTERRLLEDRGYSFASSSDTEVVLRMYEHYGDDFLLRLRGMFALAVYDKSGGPGRERLLLARDRFGVKPLLYARVGRHLLFASELKALLASGLLRPEVDPVALRLLLTFGAVQQPRTILRGVKMLPPAHLLVVGSGAERPARYWSLDTDRRAGLRGASYPEMVCETARALDESVRLQLVSDVPVGAFLSGGVDSSLLAALMTRAGGRRVKTFSVGFEAEGQGLDETDEAAHTARLLGTDHTRVLVRGREVRDRIRHIASSLDQPSVDGVNSYFVSLAARRSVTVALSGTGADELFAGYYWFFEMARERRAESAGPWKAAARALLAAAASHRALDPLLLGRGGEHVWRARRRAGFLAKYATKFYNFGSLRAARLLSAELRGRAQAGRAPRHDLRGIDELPGGTTLERVTGLCLRGYMNNQLLRDTDAVSMAHSLEVRVPYLDHHLVDLALSLPDEVKLRESPRPPPGGAHTYGSTGAKRILLDIARPLLAIDFRDRPKRGFVLPFDAWLRGPLREVSEEMLSESRVRRRGLLNPAEVAAVRRSFFAGDRDAYLGWTEPWLLLMLELWCSEILDRPRPPAAGRGERT